MTSVEFYIKIYSMLENVTPLSKDCGVLCDKACCKEDGERAGMLLFPYEEAMLENADFGFIDEYPLKYCGKNMKIFFCDEPCNRKFRPLACRIFPLAPYIKNDKLRIIMNPLAKKMCPLARSLEKEQLEEEFVINVTKAMKRIVHLKGGKEYIKAVSENIDDFLQMQNMFK